MARPKTKGIDYGPSERSAFIEYVEKCEKTILDSASKASRSDIYGYGSDLSQWNRYTSHSLNPLSASYIDRLVRRMAEYKEHLEQDFAEKIRFLFDQSRKRRDFDVDVKRASFVASESCQALRPNGEYKVAVSDIRSKLYDLRRQGRFFEARNLVRHALGQLERLFSADGSEYVSDIAALFLLPVGHGFAQIDDEIGQNEILALLAYFERGYGATPYLRYVRECLSYHALLSALRRANTTFSPHSGKIIYPRPTQFAQGALKAYLQVDGIAKELAPSFSVLGIAAAEAIFAGADPEAAIYPNRETPRDYLRNEAEAAENLKHFEQAVRNRITLARTYIWQSVPNTDEAEKEMESAHASMRMVPNCKILEASVLLAEAQIQGCRGRFGGAARLAKSCEELYEKAEAEQSAGRARLARLYWEAKGRPVGHPS